FPTHSPYPEIPPCASLHQHPAPRPDVPQQARRGLGREKPGTGGSPGQALRTGSITVSVAVLGPRFRKLKIGAGHRLDVKASGVFGGSGPGAAHFFDNLHSLSFFQVYTVGGLFGKATDDFSDTGNLVEKTTFDHITREKLERILAVIQGTNQKALLMYSNIDMKTQEAYELAVKGLIRPMGKSPPIITAVRCIQFALPEFQLEIHCLHETQQYLRKLVHEIGLELKSSAVCTQVRRIRDGVFTVDDALPRTQWNLQSIQEAIRNCQLKVETELEKTLGHGENSPVHQLGGDMAEHARQERP
uniref:TruB pseudouridine synthase family member 2 n=1 Tax=Cyanistes caeruleus TaxID=156563 RepID=A0A8C0VQV3_CYACU